MRSLTHESHATTNLTTFPVHTQPQSTQHLSLIVSVQVKSESHNIMTSSPPTEEELEKLREFRSRVSKIYPQSDLKLLAWLRARDLDLAKAEQMLRRHLIWRKNNEIEHLANWKSPKVFFPYIHFGYDKEGAPVYLMPIGRWEMRACIENGDIVPSLRYIYQVLENIISTANKQGIYEGIVICDFDGFGYRQVAHRGVLQGMQEVLRVFESNYPEVLKAAFVINAPKVFNYLFALVKPMLNSRTLGKVQIFGANRPKWQEALLARIDADQIPPYWGGCKKGSDDYCSEAWFMEPLPPNFLKKSASTYDEYGEEWVTIKVPAKDKVDFVFNVRPDQVEDAMLKWGFYTEGYDIGFAVYYGNQEEYLVQPARVESHVQKEEGFCHLDKPGTYTLVFDNSYSRQRAKVLHYSVVMTANLEVEEFHDVNENGADNNNDVNFNVKL